MQPSSGLQAHIDVVPPSEVCEAHEEVVQSWAVLAEDVHGDSRYGKACFGRVLPVFPVLTAGCR